MGVGSQGVKEGRLMESERTRKLEEWGKVRGGRSVVRMERRGTLGIVKEFCG